MGRIEYDLDKAKGVLDRSFPSIKIPFHKDVTLNDLVRKCSESVWKDSSASDEHEYYLADGGGMAIGSDFILDCPDGKKQTLQWTLGNYLKVSNIKIVSES